MLKRKALDALAAWKSNNQQKALIVGGARQVGKTYIVREFGKRSYRSFIELNFIETPVFGSIFEDSLSADAILEGIRLYLPDSQILPRETLLFLDEIQECPNAITALKFLAADARIDVIASGSALGMAYNRVSSFPVGSTDYLDMQALDFEEFLWAIGTPEETIEGLRARYRRREAVPAAIHTKLLQNLRQYMVLGGMPEVVRTYVETGDYRGADAVQRRIYRDYLADIARFARPEIKIKAEACYRSIPVQLTKQNHKFQYSVVEKKGTARKFESSLDWITGAGMAIPVTNVGNVEYPLMAHELPEQIRLYPNDIGLLICTYDYHMKMALLTDGQEDAPSENLILRTAKGGLYEALVADMLVKAGFGRLHFYRNEAGTAEMEFLIENEDGVIPVEVKAGRAGARTLTNLLKKDNIANGYKLTSGNVGVDGKCLTLPLYMGMFLKT